MSIRIRESRFLAALLAVLHGLAIVALPAVDLPVAILLTLAICVAASLARLAVAAVRAAHGSGMLLEFRSGQWWVEGHAATLMADSCVLPGIQVLRLRTAGGMVALRVLPDSADAPARRRLRVLLRHGLSTVSSARSAVAG
ncbi:MAG: hypothetical protein KBG75_04890 [Pseudomonadales bacterium]|nr:hypothetical protein [Pseudomonadales bacterium]